MYSLDSIIQEAIRKLELRITVNSLIMAPYKTREEARTSNNENTKTQKLLAARKVIDECCEAIEKLQILKSFTHRTKHENIIKILNNYGQFSIEEIQDYTQNFSSKKKTTHDSNVA